MYMANCFEDGKLEVCPMAKADMSIFLGPRAHWEKVTRAKGQKQFDIRVEESDKWICRIIDLGVLRYTISLLL